MSRLPRDRVWFQEFGNAEHATCPLCCVNSMDRDSSDTWQREHILRLSLGGTDTYPNLIPICRSCNLAAGKRSRSTFDYMVRIGRITVTQAQEMERRHLLLCAQFDPFCECLQNNGIRCANLKGGKNEFYCWKHISANLDAMDMSV
jgi:hypothetical protein